MKANQYTQRDYRNPYAKGGRLEFAAIWRAGKQTRKPLPPLVQPWKRKVAK